MKNQKTIGVRISRQTWEMLIALEKFNGQTKSEMIRKMLDIYVKQLYDKLPNKNTEEK